jgi:hypothetical protein
MLKLGKTYFVLIIFISSFLVRLDSYPPSTLDRSSSSELRSDSLGRVTFDSNSVLNTLSRIRSARILHFEVAAVCKKGCSSLASVSNEISLSILQSSGRYTSQIYNGIPNAVVVSAMILLRRSLIQLMSYSE